MIRALQHVAIDVDDLDAALGFYTEGLGLEVAERPASLGANGAWLSTGSGQIHLVEVETFVAPAASPHLALEVDDVDAAVATLRGRDIEVSDPFDVGAGRQAFLHDPAGNMVELNQPTP